MSDGRHLLILPFTYAIFLPICIFFIEIFSIPEFFSQVLMILGFIIVAWNLIEYYQIFNKQKANSKKFLHAFQSKKLIKLFFIVAIALIGAELTLEYTEYKTILSENNVEQFDAQAIILFQFKTVFVLSFLYSVWPIIIPIMFSGYYYGKSYGYFKIGLNTSEKIEKIWTYHKALESYNHYLSEILGVSIKHLQEIESKIISEDINSVDEKIKTLFLNHDDKLKPIIELSKWAKIDNENIFQTNNFWVNSEKWSKFLPIISTVLIASVLIFLHYNPPNIP